MNKVIHIIASVILCTTAAYSQHVVVSATAEKTVAGAQYGTMLVYQTSHQWSFGAFYQVSMPRRNDNENTLSPFCGIVVNAPLLRAERLNFFGQLRAGLVENNFAVLVPGLETEIKLSDRFRFAVGTSIRMTYPALTTRISVKL